MDSKDAELDHIKQLLQTTEQARNDIRNTLIEATDKAKFIEEKEKATQKLIIGENTKLKDDGADLKKL